MIPASVASRSNSNRALWGKKKKIILLENKNIAFVFKLKKQQIISTKIYTSNIAVSKGTLKISQKLMTSFFLHDLIGL